MGTTADEAFFVRCDAENNPPRRGGRQVADRDRSGAGAAGGICGDPLGRTDDSFEIEEKRGRGYGNG